jgi:hypothetical protein
VGFSTELYGATLVVALQGGHKTRAVQKNPPNPPFTKGGNPAFRGTELAPMGQTLPLHSVRRSAATLHIRPRDRVYELKYWVSTYQSKVENRGAIKLMQRFG